MLLVGYKGPGPYGNWCLWYFSESHGEDWEVTEELS